MNFFLIFLSSILSQLQHYQPQKYFSTSYYSIRWMNFFALKHIFRILFKKYFSSFLILILLSELERIFTMHKHLRLRLKGIFTFKGKMMIIEVRNNFTSSET